MQQSKHIVQAFDKDLAELRKKIGQLFQQAEKQLKDSLNALKNNDLELAEYTRKQDINANRLETEIDNDIINIIALRQPMANDLRFLLTAVKVGVDLERIADKAKSIAKTVLSLSESNIDGALASQIANLGNMTESALNKASQAYLTGDTDIAKLLIANDLDVDSAFHDILNHFLAQLRKGGIKSEYIVQLITVSKNLERIGDHIKNIAEHTFFIQDGVYPPRDFAKNIGNDQPNTKATQKATTPIALLDKHLLICDDDPMQTQLLKNTLTQAGYSVTVTNNATTAIVALMRNQPDLIMINWTSENIAPTELVTTIYSNISKTDITIIAISNHDDEDIRIAAFNNDVDDFIVQPFSSKELLAKIGVFIRKNTNPTIIQPNPSLSSNTINERIVYDDLWIDITSQRAGRGRKELHLSHRDFEILHLFMTHPNKVLSRSDILQNIWGQNVHVGERTIDVHIKRLRAHLNIAGQNNPIRTVHARGYALGNINE